VYVIGGNKIGDAGCKYICDTLQVNTTIKIIDLGKLINTTSNIYDMYDKLRLILAIDSPRGGS
jgi:hypothetical protein